MMKPNDDLKRQAADFAVGFIRSGMVVGLGEGSTALWAVRRIAQLVQDGTLTDILGVPCSLNIERVARELGVPLTTLDAHPRIDLTIDGADEVDAHFNLIKGGGGALLREKVVAQATQREIIIVDESKLSPVLGSKWAVPVEVFPFARRTAQEFLRSLGGQVAIRKNKTDDAEFITDQGNLILDARFAPIAQPIQLAEKLNAQAGIAEHGMFIGLTHDLVVAGASGVRHVQVKL